MAVYSFSTLFFKEEMYFYFIFNSLDIPARCCCFFSSVDVLGCPIEGEGKEKRLGTPKYGRQSIGGEKIKKNFNSTLSRLFSEFLCSSPSA
jgi:hypothetical protein